jgi:hypothetical protein
MIRYLLFLTTIVAIVLLHMYSTGARSASFVDFISAFTTPAIAVAAVAMVYPWRNIGFCLRTMISSGAPPKHNKLTLELLKYAEKIIFRAIFLVMFVNLISVLASLDLANTKYISRVFAAILLDAFYASFYLILVRSMIQRIKIRK